MDIRRRLDKEFGSHESVEKTYGDSHAAFYENVAEGYSQTEGVISVLSDLPGRHSHVFYGRFAKMLDLSRPMCPDTIPSIWEQEILDIIHADDLEAKMLNELLFFHYIRTLPVSRRFGYALYQMLRMRGRSGDWVNVLHRMYYIPDSTGSTVRYALCLYGPLVFSISGGGMVVDCATGAVSVLDKSTRSRILSGQELAVLHHVDCGRKSREIAELMNISVNTVSRHRQNIIAKLKAGNSSQACRIARSLNLIT